MPRRVFNPVRFYLAELEDPEAKEKLERLFLSVEGFRRLSVEAERRAAVGMAEAQAAQAQVIKSVNQFLEEAKDSFPMIATEALWQPYRDKKGNVVIESLFTQRDQRNAYRAARAQLERQAETGDYNDMFEDGDAE